MTHPLTPSAREGEESHNNKNGRIGGATLVALITWESHIKSAVETAPPKIPFVMLSEAKHLFAIPNMVNFVKGDRGLNCEAAPYPPLTPNPCTLLN